MAHDHHDHFMHAMGQMLENIPRAVRLLKRGFSESHAPSEYVLGLMFEHGIGVPMDLEQGIHLQQKSEQGAISDKSFVESLCTVVTKEFPHPTSGDQALQLARALICLSGAVAFKRGDRGLPRDYDAAKRLYRVAKELGLRKARVGLAHLVFQTTGDLEETQALLWEAVGMEDPEAMIVQAHMIVQHSKPINYRLASYLCMKAAYMGEVDGMILIAIMYINGLSVTQDVKHALEILKCLQHQTDFNYKPQTAKLLDHFSAK